MAKRIDNTALELWRPPRDCGEPIGCLSTTYTFDAGFFEEQCLARFLEIDAQPDNDGLAYLLERENRLGAVYTGVLVDFRNAGVDHSLRWDVLPVRLAHSKQHAKITLLAWTKHVRVIVTSANLTIPGYRINQEVAGVLDFTAEDAPKVNFAKCVDFLTKLVGFVPAGTDGDTACDRAIRFLKTVEKRVSAWPEKNRRGAEMYQHVVFTSPAGPRPSDNTKPHGVPNMPGQSTIKDCLKLCQRIGGAPARVKVISPFFDTPAPEGHDEATHELVKKMSRRSGSNDKRVLTLCLPTENDEEGTVQRLLAPRSLYIAAQGRVNSLHVETLPQRDSDENLRIWHAKMFYLQTSSYSALMVGSSNFTKAGLGIGGVANAEVNLLTIVPYKKRGRQKGELDACWPPTTIVKNPETAEWLGPVADGVEEEKDTSPPIPAGFLNARYRAGDSSGAIILAFNSEKLPSKWSISQRADIVEQPIYDSDKYAENNRPKLVEIQWRQEQAPRKLLVRWDECFEAFWPINIEEPSQLPMPPELSQMSVQDILFILAASDSSAAFRVWARRQQTEHGQGDELDDAIPPDLDPLNRYNLGDTFLRRVRRKARLHAAVRRNLERPVWRETALRWRLEGIIGIARVIDRLCDNLNSADGKRMETVLHLADLMMMLAEVEYKPEKGALAKEIFDRIFADFLDRTVTEIDNKVGQFRKDIPSDVQKFWRRVMRRCRS